MLIFRSLCFIVPVLSVLPYPVELPQRRETSPLLSAPVSPAFNPNHPRCSSFCLVSLLINSASLRSCFVRGLCFPQPFMFCLRRVPTFSCKFCCPVSLLLFTFNKFESLVLPLSFPVSVCTWAQHTTEHDALKPLCSAIYLHLVIQVKTIRNYFSRIYSQSPHHQED